MEHGIAPTEDGGALLVGVAGSAYVEKRGPTGQFVTNTVFASSGYTPLSIARASANDYWVAGQFLDATSNAMSGFVGHVSNSGAAIGSVGVVLHSPENKGDYLNAIVALKDGSAAAVGTSAAASQSVLSTPKGWFALLNANSVQINKSATWGAKDVPLELKGIAVLHDGSFIAVGSQQVGGIMEIGAGPQGAIVHIGADGAFRNVIAAGAQNPVAVLPANQNSAGTAQSYLLAVAAESTTATSTIIIAAGQVKDEFGTNRSWTWRASVTDSSTAGGPKVITQLGSGLLTPSQSGWQNGMAATVVSFNAANCTMAGPDPQCNPLNWRVNASSGNYTGGAMLMGGQLAAVGYDDDGGYFQFINPSDGANSCS